MKLLSALLIISPTLLFAYPYVSDQIRKANDNEGEPTSGEDSKYDDDSGEEDFSLSKIVIIAPHNEISKIVRVDPFRKNDKHPIKPVSQDQDEELANLEIIRPAHDLMSILKPTKVEKTAVAKEKIKDDPIKPQTVKPKGRFPPVSPGKENKDQSLLGERIAHKPAVVDPPIPAPDHLKDTSQLEPKRKDHAEPAPIPPQEVMATLDRVAGEPADIPSEPQVPESLPPQVKEYAMPLISPDRETVGTSGHRAPNEPAAVSHSPKPVSIIHTKGGTPMLPEEIGNIMPPVAPPGDKMALGQVERVVQETKPDPTIGSSQLPPQVKEYAMPLIIPGQKDADIPGSKAPTTHTKAADPSLAQDQESAVPAGISPQDTAGVVRETEAMEPSLNPLPLTPQIKENEIPIVFPANGKADAVKADRVAQVPNIRPQSPEHALIDHSKMVSHPPHVSEMENTIAVKGDRVAQVPSIKPISSDLAPNEHTKAANPSPPSEKGLMQLNWPSHHNVDAVLGEKQLQEPAEPSSPKKGTEPLDQVVKKNTMPFVFPALEKIKRPIAKKVTQEPSANPPLPVISPDSHTKAAQPMPPQEQAALPAVEPSQGTAPAHNPAILPQDSSPLPPKVKEYAMPIRKLVQKHLNTVQPAPRNSAFPVTRAVSPVPPPEQKAQIPNSKLKGHLRTSSKGKMPLEKATKSLPPFSSEANSEGNELGEDTSLSSSEE